MLGMKMKARFWRCHPMAYFIGLSLVMMMLAPAFAQEDQKEVNFEAGFYYTVKKGDTLWDISQHFNDSPWQWPDLWRENDQLPNPHWIYPGERIRLFRKKDKQRYQEPPTVTPQAQVSTPEPATPIPEVGFHYGPMDRVGFIRQPPVQPLGVLFKVLLDKQMISTQDQVYIRYPDSGSVVPFSPGQRLTVYRTLSPYESHSAQETIGTQHYLLGIIELTAVKPEYAIAKVIKSHRNIKVGDLLMAYQPQSSELLVTESTPGILGQIIVSEEHNKLIGDRMVAFIDKGEDDNIRPGQIYTISYQETESPPSGASFTLDPIDIGSLVVLRTEKSTATVFITQASDAIVPGQMIRTP
jgi:hypothetical protein